MSSFMFYRFDYTMAWTGYSFYDHRDTLFVGLVTPEFFTDIGVLTTAKQTYSTISQMSDYVVSATGSVQNLINVHIHGNPSAQLPNSVLYANDYSWYPSTTSARGAVIYDEDGMLICVIDFSTTQSTVGGTFSIPFSNGIIRIR